MITITNNNTISSSSYVIPYERSELIIWKMYDVDTANDNNIISYQYDCKEIKSREETYKFNMKK